MSLKETKKHLLELLGDTDNKVIALTGKWGTGKTHLWSEVMKESQDKNVNGALYVSLFGLSGIDQVKSALVEAAMPLTEVNRGIFNLIKPAAGSILKLAETIHKGFSSLNGLSLSMLATAVLRNKVIVIDDIERKHANLGIDLILGFIDEYTQRRDTRFILVLNSDKLADRKVWDTLREKAIDQELTLLTTPEEAFAIAIGRWPSRYADAIKRASVICKLSNIRIIGKVIKAANRILGERDLAEAQLTRMIPSIVLFAAIHYKGLEGGPDFQFALGIGSSGVFGRFLKDKNREPTEEERLQSNWRLLMRELGIYACDEFEFLVVEFLESGLLDANKLAPIIERYCAETRRLDAQKEAGDFLEKCFWDHRLCEDQLLEMARKLPAIADLLDAYRATELDLALADIPGGNVVGREIIDAWISSFKAQPSDYVDDGNPFNKPLHDAIAAEFALVNAKAQARTSVVDACIHIIEKSSWGTKQTLALKGATVADFETAIRGMEIEKLRHFLPHMIQVYRQNQANDQHFGSGPKHFVDACRAIANDPAAGRLATLIKRLFAGAGLAVELVPPQSLQGTTSAQANSTVATP